MAKVKWAVTSWPSFSVSHSRPPWPSTIERLMARPMPRAPYLQATLAGSRLERAVSGQLITGLIAHHQTRRESKPWLERDNSTRLLSTSTRQTKP